MAKYVAYNKMYVKGRSIGRRYPVTEGATRAEALKKATSYNTSWNRMKMNSSKGYKAKVDVVKKLR